MEHIYEIIGKLLALAFLALLGWIAPKAREWFTANTSKAAQERLEQMVTAFARAAEQMFYNVDPTGEKRNQYVKQQLKAMGVEITSAVINMIESAVWEINTETKKAQVQAKALSSEGVAHENG